MNLTSEMLDTKILISGDSFAAKWPGNFQGWPEMLANRYNVKNVAQAGVSEYKIWQQIKKEKTSDYDIIIVCHTSAYRVHTVDHPYHKEGLHKDADLIYSDIAASTEYPEVTKHLMYYFEHIFDLTYATDVHNLIKEQIIQLTNGTPSIHLTFFPLLKKEVIANNEVNLHQVWKGNAGNVNHMNLAGNRIVYDKLNKLIDNITITK